MKSQYTAQSFEKGIRLDKFITEKLEEFTRSHILKLIENGQVCVNGQPCKKAGYALREGDKIEVNIIPPKQLNLEAEDIDIDIVYEDKDIAVINKARGMVVHPAAGAYSGTLVNALLFKLDSLSGINGVIRPGIVHRLDKDTSGLLVIAKNDKSHVELQRQIAQKEAKRLYLALVNGTIKQDEGIIDAPLARGDNERKKIFVKEGGRNAVTLYKAVKRYKDFTLCEFELKTGRTHQIRVHCKHIGHIIVGDKVYGDKDYFKVNGQLLHAYKLIIKHPTTGEIMTFEAPLPSYFQQVLDNLNNAN